jgi:hypothetical protein
MVQVKADEAMLTLLGPLKERAEVLDHQGKLLGYFTPVDTEAELLRRKIFADYESGEYQKRKAMSEGQEKYTTEQVLERLRSLVNP